MSEERTKECRTAEKQAQAILKKGDRVRATKCPGTKRTFIFDHWDGQWMVSKSGINDYHPASVDLVNGIAVDFKFICSQKRIRRIITGQIKRQTIFKNT